MTSVDVARQNLLAHPPYCHLRAASPGARGYSLALRNDSVKTDECAQVFESRPVSHGSQCSHATYGEKANKKGRHKAKSEMPRNNLRHATVEWDQPIWGRRQTNQQQEQQGMQAAARDQPATTADHTACFQRELRGHPSDTRARQPHVTERTADTPTLLPPARLEPSTNPSNATPTPRSSHSRPLARHTRRSPTRPHPQHAAAAQSCATPDIPCIPISHATQHPRPGSRGLSTLPHTDAASPQPRPTEQLHIARIGPGLPVRADRARQCVQRRMGKRLRGRAGGAGENAPGQWQMRTTGEQEAESTGGQERGERGVEGQDRQVRRSDGTRESEDIQQERGRRRGGDRVQRAKENRESGRRRAAAQDGARGRRRQRVLAGSAGV